MNASSLRTFPDREIQRTIRAQSRGKPKESCFICGQHKEITELHHIVSVEEMAKAIKTYSIPKVPNVTVWLCPNHHALWHWFRGHGGRDEALDNEDLTEEVVKSFTELENRARREFWDWIDIHVST